MLTHKKSDPSKKSRDTPSGHEKKKITKSNFNSKLRGPRSYLPDGPLHNFIRTLKTTLALTETKKKPTGAGQRVSDVVYTSDAETTGLASAFVNMGTVYTFRLAGHISTVVSNSSGIINTFVPFDPSAAGVNFPEWSTLSALFSEFRLKEFGCQFVASQVTLFPAGNPQPLLIASNLGTATNPGSYASVADNADSKQWSVCTDTSGLGYTHRVKNLGLNWSQVTTPTTEPYAGAPGSIQMYMDSGATWGTTGTVIVSILAWGIYEFRSRV